MHLPTITSGTRQRLQKSQRPNLFTLFQLQAIHSFAKTHSRNVCCGLRHHLFPKSVPEKVFANLFCVLRLQGESCQYGVFGVRHSSHVQKLLQRLEPLDANVHVQT